jgi:hypothetical protein
MRTELTVASVLLLTLTGGVEAQWLKQRDPRVPRGPDGRPVLTAPAPRGADGKPDLSGVWHVEAESLEEKRRLFGPDFGAISTVGMEATTTSKYSVDVLVDFKPGEIAMTPKAEAIYQRRRQGQESRPTTICLPAGVPLATLVSEAHKIVQTPGLIMITHELDGGMSRQIYTDGRALPIDITVPSWLGYSIGRWDDNTLVVETIGFNDRSWLDFRGHPRSEAMHITERYRRRDVGHLDVEITFDDPESYNRPFTVRVTHLLQVDADILEYVCAEGDKDRGQPGK